MKTKIKMFLFFLFKIYENDVKLQINPIYYVEIWMLT